MLSFSSSESHPLTNRMTFWTRWKFAPFSSMPTNFGLALLMVREASILKLTLSGYLMLYRVHLATEFGSPMCLSVGKYQPGKRLSPAHGLAQAVPPNRQQTYYIPTESEKQVEERNSSMECMMEGPERQASRKISVKIDQNTRKYSGLPMVLTFYFDASIFSQCFDIASSQH